MKQDEYRRLQAMKRQRRFKNMNIFGRAAGFTRARIDKRNLAFLVLLALLFATWPQNLWADQIPQPPAQATQAPPHAQQTPEQLQRVVAPIALYPDSLVAQVLAASTFPEQVVEANRWVQANPDLKGEALGQAVDKQPWDPSVKALAAFPSVLGNMDKNLSWTSSLGDAYYNQQQDVMDAIQVMRQKAEQAGNLKSTPQQVVTTEGSSISVAPASPEIVYVPAYDPWVVYGPSIDPWPYWYPYPGIWYDGPYLSFGVGFGIGWWGGFGWGWGNWGFDWHHRYATYGHGRYYSRSNTFYNRNTYYRGGGQRGVAEIVRGGGSRGGAAAYSRSDRGAQPFNGDSRAARGYAEPHGQSGVHSGAFSGYEHGGQERSFSSRGGASLGGSGGSHGGGGGESHGGGGGESHGGGGGESHEGGGGGHR
jgi:hypothetical protein